MFACDISDVKGTSIPVYRIAWQSNGCSFRFSHFNFVLIKFIASGVLCFVLSSFLLDNKSAESWKWKSNKILNDFFVLQMTFHTTIALLVVVEFDEFFCIWFNCFVSCSLNGQVFFQQYKFRFLLLFRLRHCVRCASILFIFSQVLRFVNS